jgi:hypothetical protein
MTIRIDVERLVIDGIELDARGAEALRAAVAAELVRLFEQRRPGAGLGGGAVPMLRAPAVQFDAGASPTRMGSQVAQAVYGSIGR